MTFGNVHVGTDRGTCFIIPASASAFTIYQRVKASVRIPVYIVLPNPFPEFKFCLIGSVTAKKDVFHNNKPLSRFEKKTQAFPRFLNMFEENSSFNGSRGMISMLY